MKFNFRIIGCAIVFMQLLQGCAPLRTEFYREETKHLYGQGCLAYKQGEYKTAESSLLEIVRLDPDYGPAYATLGNIAMIREHYDQASSYYRQAISHDPELKEKLLPALMVSKMHQARQPLLQAGIDLSVVYPLLMEDRKEELQTLFERNLPLKLLAKDTVSLTPGQLGELRRKAAEIAPGLPADSSYSLFVASFLFYSGEYDQITEDLLQAIIKAKNPPQRGQAYLLLARLQERSGHTRAAVDGYLAAVDAGIPMAAVAHHLARIYRVDIDTVLPVKSGTEKGMKTSAGVAKGSLSAVTSGYSADNILIIHQETTLSFPLPQARRHSQPE